MPHCLNFFFCLFPCTVEEADGAPIAQICDEAIAFEVIDELDNHQRNHHMSKLLSMFVAN